MESIGRFVLEQLAAWEVPGCAVAAVRDGHILLAAGWGQRDLDSKLPVTPDTLFAIGSTTKAFTAATVGALVDDGLLEWERPLRDYVPELRLSDPVVTDRLTLVDLLSHRSGLPRHEMVWLGHPGRSRAEIVRRLWFLPLSKDLRQAFQYCNLGYLLAGHASTGRRLPSAGGILPLRRSASRRCRDPASPAVVPGQQLPLCTRTRGRWPDIAIELTRITPASSSTESNSSQDSAGRRLTARCWSMSLCT